MITKIFTAVKKSVIILLLVFLTNCSSKHNGKSEISDNPVEIDKSDMNTGSNDSTFSENFFRCDGELQTWFGDIQYFQRKEDRGYVFANCLSHKNSYIVIWDIDRKLYPKGQKVPLEERQRLFRDGNGLIKDNFTTYIFHMPFMENFEEIDLFVDVPYKFPCNVDVFVSELGTNKFTKKGSYYITEWDSMAKLQYNIVNDIK